MNNLNRIGQYIATSASAALLASFATLAAPTTAQAASLSFNGTDWESSNPEEAVEKILGINIGDKTYNVTFTSLTGQEILDDIANRRGSALFGGETAKEAASRISSSLGESFFTHVFSAGFSNPSNRYSDYFFVVDGEQLYDLNILFSNGVSGVTDLLSSDLAFDFVTSDRVNLLNSSVVLVAVGLGGGGGGLSLNTGTLSNFWFYHTRRFNARQQKKEKRLKGRREESLSFSFFSQRYLAHFSYQLSVISYQLSVISS